MSLREYIYRQPIFAFNIDDLAILRGVVEAIFSKKKRAILQFSPGEASFWGIDKIKLVDVDSLKKEGFYLNLDHGREFALLRRALSLGFDMVHLDGSGLSFEESIRKTRKIVKLARQKGILVEGEFSEKLTDPIKASQFVGSTGVDFLAVFVGNRHGLDPSQPERLDLALLRQIKKAVGEEVFLTLHGGSGVFSEDLKKALKDGLVAKVNINSSLRTVYKEALRKSLDSYSGVRVYELLSPVVEAVAEEVDNLLSLLPD